MRALGQQADLAWVRTAAEWIYRVLPDLESFNLTIQAAHGLAISPQEIWLPMLYAVGYAIALLFAASFIFRRRDMN
jgi:ABC-type transport system involved in multi-copper enzyme maturation permease subunit